MAASAVGVMATSATALALNLGLIGQSTVSHAALAGTGTPVSTVVEYQDVYDLPPTTTIAVPSPTVVSPPTPVTTSPPAPAVTRATPAPSPVVPMTPATTAPPVTSPPVTTPPTTVPAKPPAPTTTTLPWWAGRLTIPGGRR